MKTKTLQINKPIHGKLPGDTVVVDCDRDGVIIDRHWRRRLQDSELDKCVTVVKPKTKQKAPGV